MFITSLDDPNCALVFKIIKVYSSAIGAGMRLFRGYISILSNSSNPRAPRFVIVWDNLPGSHLGNDVSKSGYADTWGHTDLFGVLNIWKILYNWPISESPGNKGSWRFISAKIYPTDHVAIAVQYFWPHNNISGER